MVLGILHHVDVIQVLASLGRPVIAYDSTSNRRRSVLSESLSTFAEPKRPANVEYRFDDEGWPEERIGALFILDNAAMAQKIQQPELKQGTIVIGEERQLNDCLRGHKFWPRGKWRDLFAVEIA